MGKRRTRKQKETARHRFTLVANKPNVKRQNNIGLLPEIKPDQIVKKAESMTQVANSGTVKRDILKSLILASLILSLEIMLYLVWNR